MSELPYLILSIFEQMKLKYKKVEEHTYFHKSQKMEFRSFLSCKDIEGWEQSGFKI